MYLDGPLSNDDSKKNKSGSKRIKYNNDQLVKTSSNNPKGLINGTDHLLVNIPLNGIGLIDGNGLTNGNGLTLNLFSKQYLAPSAPKAISYKRRHENLRTKMKRTRLFQVILAVILIVIPLYIYSIEITKKEMEIQIDGEFDDWCIKDVVYYYDSDPKPVQNPSTNLTDCRVHLHDGVLDFYVQSEWEIFGSSTANTWSSQDIYKLDIFIDTDLSSATGYIIDGFGADERIEVFGQNGIITKAKSYY